jgi:hypothetical protein
MSSAPYLGPSMGRLQELGVADEIDMELLKESNIRRVLEKYPSSVIRRNQRKPS